MERKSWHEAKSSDENPLHHVDTEPLDVLRPTLQRPYKQVNFWGTYIAAGTGALAGYGGFIMPATSLQLIVADVGPSPYSYWVVLAWTLCLAVGYTLVGRLSDIFGRRWFFIGATLLAIAGCAIGATATTVNDLIGASVLTGLATSAQISFNYTLTELVPIKHRFYALTGVFLLAAPFSCFGPYISRLFIVHTALQWRWDYYANLIANGVSLICYVLFYHPPDFHELHNRRRTRWQEFKELDFVGIFLYTAGLLLFLMGLSWGGTLYPWNSAHVVVTIVVGFVLCVLFVLYEIYAQLSRPLIPMHLFQNWDYNVLTTVSAVGGMLYYSLNVLYPEMVAALFTTSVTRAGLLTMAIGGGVALGQLGGSIVATPGGNLRWKIFAAAVLSTALTAGLAGAHNEATASALATVSSVGIGAIESFAGVAVTIVIKDQTEIGTAAGVYGSIRSAAGVVATAILTTVLQNKVNSEVVQNVVPALAAAHLPEGSILPLITDLTAGDVQAAESLNGVTGRILDIALLTLTAAYENAFELVYLVTIAFGGLSCIAAFFAPSIEDLYTDEVMRQLHKSYGEQAHGFEGDMEYGSVENGYKMEVYEPTPDA